MFKKEKSNSLKSGSFKALFMGVSSLVFVMFLSACAPIDALKSNFEEDAFPALPAPEVATYVLDLSGSTYPIAQLEALGSGINDFIAGQSLGNPFAQSPKAPRGLSIQFITANSAQAPRILLVSTQPSESLYAWMKEKTTNIEGARQLWDGLMRARTQIWEDTTLESSNSACINRVIEILGPQQLLPEALQDPANTICQDAKRTSMARKRLNAFVTDPKIAMGSDVYGAIQSSLGNLLTAKSQFPKAHLTLVVASDLIDEKSKDLVKRLASKTEKQACALARTDSQGDISNQNALSEVQIVLVGVRNSKSKPQFLDLVHSYWNCYFNEIGITNIDEQSDLSGF